MSLRLINFTPARQFKRFKPRASKSSTFTTPLSPEMCEQDPCRRERSRDGRARLDTCAQSLTGCHTTLKRNSRSRAGLGRQFDVNPRTPLSCPVRLLQCGRQTITPADNDCNFSFHDET